MTVVRARQPYLIQDSTYNIYSLHSSKYKVWIHSSKASRKNIKGLNLRTVQLISLLMLTRQRQAEVSREQKEKGNRRDKERHVYNRLGKMSILG